MNTKNVGRPISKPNRVKIGLSISQESDSVLCELVKRSGKTKSRVFEEAIKYFKSREDIIYQRMLDFEQNGEKSFISQNELDELLKQNK